MRRKNIKIDDLLVNTENFRFETVVDQKEAIEKMISDQNDKLLKLAEDILQRGLNPNDNIQVGISHHDKTKYIVLEGNRRTVTLKLLLEPDLIDNKYKAIKKNFEKLHTDNKAKLIKEVECNIYDDPNEAYKWIKTKHTGQNGGIGTVEWSPTQIDRFDEKMGGKSSLRLQTLNLLKNSNHVPTTIKSDLHKLPISSLERLLTDPDVRDFLGIEIEKGILKSTVEQQEVMKGLVQIAKNLLDPKFKVSEIYTKVDRQDYIDNFPKNSIPDINKKVIPEWQFSTASSTTPTAPPRIKPNPTDRKKLIPRTCILKINKPKVNRIYNELQKIDLQSYTNAVSVLFRVFIELSIDCYIENHGLTSKPSSAKSGVDFQQKVFQVANHLETIKLADPTICKGIKVAVKDKNDILGIDTWHAYIHNNRFSPKPQNLTITWDNIQDFMIILWENTK